MTLTEILAHWVGDAERMNASPACAVVVTPELFAALVAEQRADAPTVGDLPIITAASEVDPASGLPALDEMVEIAGPDRVCVYLGTSPGDSTFPVGHDPAMPVFFIPVSPGSIADGNGLEGYNRLRWYGLGPEEALAGAG
ncbi:MAG: hypothetical protein M3066_14785 [Actinomycetota bacterium]|nr:hypothetical protein [Actinomycetota bacterium]